MCIYVAEATINTCAIILTYDIDISQYKALVSQLCSLDTFSYNMFCTISDCSIMLLLAIQRTLFISH